MPNLRIVSDNAADRGTTTVSASVGNFVAANLKNDIKSAVWRVTGTTGTISTSWTTAETVSCVVLPFCNLTPTATIRVRGYSDTAGTVQVIDSTALLACPAAAIALRGFTALAAQSAYAYGGGAYARVYITPTSVKKIVIDLVDTANTAGYIEVSRLVAGAYWSPTYNADWGAGATAVDTGKNVRTDGGDLISDRGTRNTKLTLNLSSMPAADRTSLLKILVANGISNPLFISVFPANADLELERDSQVYGKLSTVAAMTLPMFNSYAIPLEIEGI